MNQNEKLIAVAFLTEASQLVARRDQLLKYWVDAWIPREWGISNFQGTGKRLPALIVSGKVVNEECQTLSDLVVSNDLFNLELYTSEKLSNCKIISIKSQFANDTVWILGFFG